MRKSFGLFLLLVWLTACAPVSQTLTPDAEDGRQLYLAQSIRVSTTDTGLFYVEGWDTIQHIAALATQLEEEVAVEEDAEPQFILCFLDNHQRPLANLLILMDGTEVRAVRFSDEGPWLRPDNELNGLIQALLQLVVNSVQ